MAEHQISKDRANSGQAITVAAMMVMGDSKQPMEGQKYKQTTRNYRKVTSTSSSHLEAHAVFFRLPMKGKFDVYLLGNFGKKVDFHIIKTC